MYELCNGETFRPIYNTQPAKPCLTACLIFQFCYSTDGPSIEEFCTGETFRPRCSGGKNDVIMIMAARYGRMSFGRCLIDEPIFAPMANDPKFVGCFDDVKHVMDRHCSGLSECEVRINDQHFVGIQPCYAGLKMHLEVSFLCIQGKIDEE
jgi:Galactose binding lectin domain